MVGLVIILFNWVVIGLFDWVVVPVGESSFGCWKAVTEADAYVFNGGLSKQIAFAWTPCMLPDRVCIDTE